MNYVDFYRDCISDPNHSTQLASTMAPTTKGDIVMKFEKNGRSRIILKIAASPSSGTPAPLRRLARGSGGSVVKVASFSIITIHPCLIHYHQ